MQYQFSRKPRVSSNRQFHQEMMAIVGSLVVLSLCLLVFGIPSATAQTSAARCPCASGLNAVEMNERFRLEGGISQDTVTWVCRDDELETVASRSANVDDGCPRFYARVQTYHSSQWRRPRTACSYEIEGGGCEYISSQIRSVLTLAEAEACRQDIRLLIEQLPDCP
jgi:hypothetical protein